MELCEIVYAIYKRMSWAAYSMHYFIALYNKYDCAVYALSNEAKMNSVR